MADSLAMMTYRLNEVEKMLAKVEVEIATIEQRNELRDQQRQALERKQLLWGITFLGGVIMALGGVIWSYRGVIFKGMS